MGKSTLVTGGNGFIGRYLTRSLLAAGWRVVVLDRSGVACEPGAELFLGDVRDPVAVTEAVAHVDSWVHLAGVLGTQETITNPLPAAEVNVLGGLNVLQAAAQYELPGVCIAVGNHWETNTYSITKSTVERFCEMYSRYRGLPVTAVRALNAYGPGQSVAAPYGPSKVRKIIPSMVARALHGDPIEIYGDGSQVMDMVYVADVAEILRLALEATEVNGSLPTVEAGTGRRTTVSEIANLVVDTVGRGEIVHLPMRPGETPGAVVLADTSTMAWLGVDPAGLVRLETGIVETVNWYRDVLITERLDRIESNLDEALAGGSKK